MRRKRLSLLVLFLATMLILPGCNISVNKSIYIDDGETVNHGQRTVNGSIYIGSNCKVKGSCSTVNGKIKVGGNSEVRALKTVNMGITIGENSYVDGDVSTVNGSILCRAGVKIDGDASTINGGVTCETGVKINGDASTINGKIDLKKTVVKEDIKTHNGNITLTEGSIVYGDIIVKRSTNFTRRLRRLKIRIADGSVVKGDIINRDKDMDVKVYLSNGGSVMGRVERAEVIKE
ncbi:MAG: hypothetical protein KAT34_17995 [Candidatus Aminicenantes bacterium]|nr:hypothetical protein [Candidatus Aminicenantes bacterium]